MGFCASSPLVRALCRHSCDPVNFPAVHHYLFDIDKRAPVKFTDYDPCGDMDAVEVANCTAVALSGATLCYTPLVKVICAATCESLGVSTGMQVNYRNVAHNEFTPVTKSWPRGAEVDWKETPTAAYTRSVYLHPTHTIKGPQVPCLPLHTGGEATFIVSLVESGFSLSNARQTAGYPHLYTRRRLCILFAMRDSCVVFVAGPCRVNLQDLH